MFDSGGTLEAKKDNHLASDQYRHGVFLLLVYVPIVCAVLQILAWSQFSLHGKRLRWVKKIREGVLYTHI